MCHNIKSKIPDISYDLPCLEGSVSRNCRWNLLDS